MIRPPRAAQRLLLWRLLPDERDELVGDLDEQFVRRAAADGPRSAGRWYWRQTLALTWGFFVHRRDAVSTAHERRRGFWMLSGVAHDCRDATRSLRSSPGFVTVALLTLAFGIGLSTAVFSFVHGVLLKPLPYPDADRLVRLVEFNPSSPLAALGLGRPGIEATGGTLGDTTIGEWTKATETLDAIVPYSTNGRNVVLPAGTELRPVAEVGDRFFDILSVTPVEGRLFQTGDAARDAADVAVVSAAFVAAIDDGRAVVGRAIQIDDTPYTIVGVAPALSLPEPDIDVWLPGRWRWPPPGVTRNLALSLDVIARMKPGVAVDAVQQEGERVVLNIATANPAFFEGTVAVPQVRVRRLLDDIVAPVRPALVVLSIGISLVLLAACVSLATLVLSRTTARRRDVAVRLALGASRTRVVRPLIFEQLALAAGGSALGAAVAYAVLRGIPALAPGDLPRLSDVAFDVRSLIVVSCVALVTACLVGVSPVWRLPGRRSGSWARTTGLRGRADGASPDRLRSVLVICQIGLAAVLLVSAALVGRSLLGLLRVDPGYRADGVLTFQASPPDLWWRQEGRQTAYATEMMARIRTRPGVVAVGATSGLPFRMSVFRGTFWIAGRPRPTDPAERPVANDRIITPGYLDAVGTRVVRGRGFLPTDSKDAERVLLIDEVIAARHFPDQDPIGERLISFGQREWIIVGVVAATHDVDPATAPEPKLYLPAAQLAELMGFNGTSGGFAVRTTGDPLGLVPFIREQARALEPGWPIFSVELLRDRMRDATAQPRFYTVALGLFAALALTTAVLGVYGVLAYAVERRRLEFSVRRALGATERDVLRLVVGRGLVMAALGLAAGLASAAAGASLLRSQLFGIEPLDPASFLATAGLLGAVVVLASWWPARRAMGVSPVEALKAE
jgi:predicted permease